MEKKQYKTVFKVVAELVDANGNVVAPVGTKNIYLYELLKNQSNWYLPNPIY